MKKYEIIFVIIFSIQLSLILIHCDDTKNDTEKIDINENNNKESKENENSPEENESENDIMDSDAGFFITEEVFDEKLKAILEEKNLKPKKKITKQQLRLIFELIYKTEKKESDIKPEENDGINQEEHSKQFMDSIFSESTKSLDYDDKIRVKEIKEWINPTRVQKAYAELLQGLAENIDYL
mgnify:FL=1